MAAELRAAIANAIVIKLPERSWSDALNEGVVTARELHDLNSNREGNFSAIFFVRATWDLFLPFAASGRPGWGLALRALSTGKKLAHGRPTSR